MDLTIYHVDAFTDRVFTGNPAAVVPLAEWLPDDQLQAIARENNLGATGFFVPAADDADHDFHIRWFTPSVEIELCGHATLASTAVLMQARGWDRDEIRFRAKAGSLIARKRGALLELNFPAKGRSAGTTPEGLDEALAATVIDYYETPGFKLAVLENEAAVRGARPDPEFLTNTVNAGVIVTAPGDDADCVSRFFAPYIGILEDPVTGSAHCMLVPYWADRLGKTEIHARQISARGGSLHCRVDGDRVLLAGQAVLYMTGIVRVEGGWGARAA